GSPEIDYDECLLVLLIACHGIDDAVGAHLLGVVVEDGHTCLHAGLDDEGLHADVPGADGAEGHKERRYHAGDDYALYVGETDFFKIEDTVEHDGILVSGPLEDCAYAPMVDERIVPVDAENDIRIPDIDDE